MSNIPLVYADLNILALTSLNEGTPMSIIEAMASSVPVISTQVGGVPDLIGLPEVRLFEGDFAVCERGIFCRSGDPQGFSKAFSRVLREEREESAERLSRATQFVKKHYAKERLLFDMEQLFEELLERKGPKRLRGGEAGRERDHTGTNGPKVWTTDVC
jgi:glycosyltransferase involved in cell wall biosynthesis